MAAGTVRTMQDLRRTKQLKRGSPIKNEIPFAPFSSHVADIGADEVGDVFGQFFKTLKNITL
jgi:hypothetical protein